MRPENPALTFIAGPFRGRDNFEIAENVRRAERYGIVIAKAGGVPIIPHSMYQNYFGVLPEAYWRECDRAMLSVCRAIVMIAGWNGSQGSLGELDSAAEWGLETFYFSGCAEENPTMSDIVQDNLAEYDRYKAWLAALKT